MRSDLNKLLCEHERYGSKDHYKNYRNLKQFKPKHGTEGENVPMRESMKYRYGWDTKSFGENLNPLYGAVRKAVGRKWDKFYSELCKSFDKRSVINQHILQHLFDHVKVNNVFVDEDGEIYVLHKYSTRVEKLKDGSFEYYVDPRDGILKRNKFFRSYRQGIAERAKAKKAEEEKVFRQLDDGTVLRLINGVWFQFDILPVPEVEIVYVRPSGMDTFNTGWTYKPGKIKTWDELNEQERKRHGVKRIIGGTARDEFTNEIVYVDKALSKTVGSFVHSRQKKTYHANKRTAPRKILKKAGIV